MADKREAYFCACGEEILVLRAWDWGYEDTDVELAILSAKLEKKPRLWFRITEAWKTFRTGEPYTKWVVFDGVNNIRRLRDTLDAFIEDHSR